MSAGQMPSGPNFWDSNRGRDVIIGGTGVYGTSQMIRNERENHHQRVQRSTERVIKLTEGKLNPAQYVLEASRDNVPRSFVTEDLSTSAGSWDGIDFSNPKAFSVTDEWKPSHNPVKNFLGLQDKFYRLQTYPLDSVPTTKQEGEKTLTKNLGLRGGSTETIEVQGVRRPPVALPAMQKASEGVTKNGIDMATGRSKYCPWVGAPRNNLAYEVCEISPEQVQAVPDRPVKHSYSFRVISPPSPILYFLFSLGFICGSTVLVNYVQRKFSKWLDSQESRGPASTIEENSSVEAVERPSGEEAGSATKAKPEFVIETFLAYKRRLISKKKAAYILVKYYNLSEVEVLELIDAIL